MITGVRYTAENNSSIRVEPYGWELPYPTNANDPLQKGLQLQLAEVDTWVDEGNTITHFEKYYNISIESLKGWKIAEIWEEASKRNSNAEAQFSLGGNTTTRANDRINKKWYKLINKKNEGITLTTEELTFDDDYDSMLDYQDLVNDAADLAEDTTENIIDKTEVDIYDVVNAPLWPTIWIKPI